MANWKAAGGWRLGAGGEVVLRGRAAYQLPQSVLMSLQMPAAARARLKTKTDRLSIMVRQRSIVGGTESARRGQRLSAGGVEM